jgi:transposase InsO family protein
MTTNILQQRYLVAVADQIFSADITFFNRDVMVLLVIDLGTRRIAGYLLQDEPITAKQVIQLILAVREERPTDDVVIYHFDQQSIFTSQELIDFAQQHGITLSHADPHQHQNQCSEVLNKTIKEILRKKLAIQLGSDLKPYLLKKSLRELVKRFKWEDLQTIFAEVVTIYNDKPHRGKRMYNASPNLMDQALKEKPPEVVVPDKILVPNWEARS